MMMMAFVCSPSCKINSLPVRDGVRPRPDVAGGVRSLHPFEDPLGRLGRSLPAATGQARDYGVVAQGCLSGLFVLLSVPPVMLWSVT